MASKRRPAAPDQSPSQSRKKPRPSEPPRRVTEVNHNKEPTEKELDDTFTKEYLECTCSDSVSGCECDCIWKMILRPFAINVQLARRLLESTWQLKPNAIVAYFDDRKNFSTNEICWLVEFLWSCYKHGGSELTWESMYKSLKDANENSEPPGEWKKSTLNGAKTQRIWLDPEYRSDPTQIAESTTPDSSLTLDERRPRSKTSLSAQSDRGYRLRSLHQKDPTLASPKDVAVTDQVEGQTPRRAVQSEPPDVPAATYKAAERWTTRAGEESTRSDGTSQVEDDTHSMTLAQADVVKDLKSTNAISAKTLHHLLDEFLKRLKFVDLPESDAKAVQKQSVKVLNLSALIHSSSKQHHDENGDDGKSRIAYSISYDDIRNWTPITLDAPGVGTFLFPFAGPTGICVTFYVLQTRKRVCQRVCIGSSPRDDILYNVLSRKLIECVAGPEHDKWNRETRRIRGKKGERLKDEEFGLQVLLGCLGHGLFHGSYAIDTDFWRAVLATIFDEKAEEEYLHQWLDGVWAPKAEAAQPLPVNDNYLFEDSPGYMDAEMSLKRKCQRQQRVVGALKHIEVLEKRFGMERTKVQSWSTETAKQETNTIDELYKRKQSFLSQIRLSIRSFVPGKHDEFYEERARKHMELELDSIDTEELEKLRIQKQAAHNASKFQDRCQQVLKNAEKFLREEEPKVDREVHEAEVRVKDASKNYKEETERLRKLVQQREMLQDYMAKAASRENGSETGRRATQGNPRLSKEVENDNVQALPLPSLEEDHETGSSEELLERFQPRSQPRPKVANARPSGSAIRG